MNVQLKPKLFFLGMMNKQLEKSHGILFLNMITEASLLYKNGQIWQYL